MATRRQESKPGTTAEVDNPISLKGLSRAEKRAVLDRAFRAYGPAYSYSEKLTALAQRTGQTRNSLTLAGKRWDWPAVDAIQPSELQAGSLVVMEAGKEYSVSAFLKQLRNFTTSALSVSTFFTNTTERLVELTCRKIDAHIAATDASAQGWDEYAWKELQRLHTRLKSFVEPSKSYTSPGPLAALLNALDFRSGIPPEVGDVDTSAFTVARLQAYYIEANGGPSLLQDPARAESVFAAYESLMPEISARRADSGTLT